MNYFIPLALGAGAVLLLSFGHKMGSNYDLQSVKASSGRVWLVRVVSVTTNSDGIKKAITAVYAPAGSFGDNPQTLVATYEQTGANKDTRTVVSYGPNAKPDMVDAAGQDFKIKKAA